MVKKKRLNSITVWLIIVTLLTTMMPPINHMYAATEGDYEYKDNGDGTATITAYRGSSADVKIPEKINGLDVTGIGNTVFYNKNLTSISLPNTLKTIGINTFYGNKLTSVFIPSSVTSIGNVAFYNNQITNLTISDGVKSIGESAFNSNQLTEVTIPDSVTSIGANAFLNNQISNVTIPESVTNIGDYAFSSNKIAYAVIYNDSASIGSHAFGNVPNRVTIIGHDPSTAKAFAESETRYTFKNIADAPEVNYQIKNNGNGTVTITKYTGTDKDIVIPEKLGGLTISSIGNEAFKGKQLTSVTITNDSIQIGADAFANNQANPADFTIVGHAPSTAKTYAEKNSHTFKDIAELPEFIFDWTDHGDGTATITGYKGPSKEVEIPDKIGGLDVTGIGDSVFPSKNITSVTLPNTVKTIGNYAFTNNQLTSITLPNSVTSIGTDAFRKNQLESITLGENITYMGGFAFANNQLTSVTIPDNLTTIGPYVFDDNKLMELVIPRSVTSIQMGAFRNNHLTKVTVLNPSTTISNFDGEFSVHSSFAGNQDNPANLTFLGHDPSTAKDYALNNGHAFKNSGGSVTFSQNGVSTWSQSLSTKVDISGYDETKPLEYVWTTSVNTPTSGWLTFSNGSTLKTPIGTGDYYLHVKGTNLIGEIFNERTAAFKIDNTNPSLTITPSTTEVTHDDVVLTVEGSDNHSGVKRIQDPDGNWHNQDQISYNAKQNGTYSFIVEDHAGNQETESVTVSNIDKTISFEMPTISKTEAITLNDQIPTHAINMTALTVRDWRDGDNDWRIDVSANRLKMANGDYELSIGTLKLKPLSEINQVAGNGDLPSKSTTENKEIDNGKVTIAEGTNSRGEFDLIFPNSALEFLIDPTTVIIDDPDGITYETTIAWNLITAP